MPQPLVTIMIPTYNQANFVYRAIESALMQDYPNLEVVVADDCSTDNTKEVVAKYASDKRLKYYKHSTNLGRVANYKYALENLATGEWVVNLDGDDYYTDASFISYAVSLIGDRVVFIQTGRVNKEVGALENSHPFLPNIATPELTLNGADYVLQFDKIGFFSHLTTLYNRTKALELDFYRYDILSSDMESLLRLALYGNVVLSKRTCGAWVGHANNSIRQTNFEVYLRNLIWVESVANELVSVAAITPKKKKKWMRTQSLNTILHLTHIAKLTKSRGRLFVILCKKQKWVFASFRFYKLLIKGRLKILKNRELYKIILPLSLRRKLAHAYRYLYYREYAHNKALRSLIFHLKDKAGLEIGGKTPMFNHDGLLPLYARAKSVDGYNFSNHTVWEGDIASKQYCGYDGKILGEQFIGEAAEVDTVIKKQYDFIISAGCFEHIANPIKAVKGCMEVLKTNGLLLLALPNKSTSFDYRRPHTSFAHLLSDYNNNIDERDMTHYDEIVALTDLARTSDKLPYEQFLERSKNNYANRCFHHHVFSEHTLREIFNFLNIKVQYCKTAAYWIWIVGQKTSDMPQK